MSRGVARLKFLEEQTPYCSRIEFNSDDLKNNANCGFLFLFIVNLIVFTFSLQKV